VREDFSRNGTNAIKNQSALQKIVDTDFNRATLLLLSLQIAAGFSPGKIKAQIHTRRLLLATQMYFGLAQQAGCTAPS
jgi:hypothetical protein